jgi:hypothetical protein
MLGINFLKTLLPGILEDVILALKQRLLVHSDGAIDRYRNTRQQLNETSWEVDWVCREDCMAFSDLS